MQTGPFVVSQRRFDQRCNMQAYVIEAYVQRGVKRVLVTIAAQITRPSLDQCLDAAREARTEHRITTLQYQSLYHAAVACGYVAPKCSSRVKTSHVPYYPVEFGRGISRAVRSETYRDQQTN